MKIRHWLRIKSYASVPYERLDRLPAVSGIYYCMRGTDLLYLGETTNLYERWNSSKYGKHHKTYQLDKYGCRVVHFRPVPRHRLKWVEAREIKRLEPEFNIVKPDPMHWLTPHLIFEFTGEWLVKGLAGLIGLAMFARIAWLVLMIFI